MTIQQQAPDGAQIVDLVAARAARAEVDASLPPALLKIDAGYIEIRREIDVLSAEDFTNGQFRAGLSKLLADPADVDELVAFGLSKGDLELIVNYITGKTLGE